jgi:hypothetical protein
VPLTSALRPNSFWLWSLLLGSHARTGSELPCMSDIETLCLG